MSNGLQFSKLQGYKKIKRQKKSMNFTDVFYQTSFVEQQHTSKTAEKCPIKLL